MSGFFNWEKVAIILHKLWSISDRHATLFIECFKNFLTDSAPSKISAMPLFLKAKQTQSLLISAKLVVALRCLFFCIFTLAANEVLQSGSSSWSLCFAAVCGILLASHLGASRLRTLGFIVLCGAIFISFQAVFWIASFLPLTLLENVFALYSVHLHSNLAFAVFTIAALSTWTFWRFSIGVTFEAIILAALSVYAFSGHRNFHFESPKFLNTLAWAIGVQDLKMIVACGLILSLALIGYLFFSGLALAYNPSKDVSRRIEHKGKTRLLTGSLVCASYAAVLLLLAHGVFQHYNSIASTRIANGVGQGNAENMSPLGFHSALGGSNQPSALVRLEGDYSKNPFSPMLYLRESALSLFDGRELVMASRNFDRDVSANRPDEPYEGQEDASLGYREPLTQSVYLLSQHKSAFAVDYPLSIRQLKNPNPARFKSAYRAYSAAPSFAAEDIDKAMVGDPRWNAEEKALYLKQHPDKRYSQLAKQITEGISAPIEKARAITTYLSKKSIYTLQPGHEVAPDEDPVAPYLFGDFRGYCVHFAHSMVYLMRAVGIPARIATGYLTDLSQSKDGHILLRMSDRHAWAEVYIAGKGWIPFDVKPEQVESHAETAVDMKLLEELMGMLGPDEEILPKDIAKDELNVEPESQWNVPDWRYLLIPFAASLLLLLCLKLFLFFGWILPAKPARKLRRAYVAMLCRLHDAGIKRDEGETRTEFQQRISQITKLELLRLTEALQHHTYATQPAECFSLAEINKATKADMADWRKIPLLKRLWALFNPSSVYLFLSGGKW